MRGRQLQFIHIPKCAGTSVFHGLQSALDWPTEYIPIPEFYEAGFQLEGTIQDPLAYERRMAEFRQHFLLALLNRGIRLVGSHLPFSPRAYEIFADSCAFHTVLRDPEERLYSHLLFNARAEERRIARSGGQPSLRVGDRLRRTIESPALELPSNKIRKNLGGLDYDGVYREEGSTERAVAHLDLLETIGFLDSLEEYAGAVERRYGTRPRFERENTAAHNRQTGENLPAGWPEAWRDRLVACWADDAKVVAAARNPEGRRREQRRTFAAWLGAYGVGEEGPLFRAWWGEFRLGAAPWILHETYGWVRLLPTEDPSRFFPFTSPGRGDWRCHRNRPGELECLGSGDFRPVLRNEKGFFEIHGPAGPGTFRPFRR